MIKRNFKLILVGCLALYLQFFWADYLEINGSLANFLLPFGLLSLLVWGVSKKTIWLLFWLGLIFDVININLFGFTPFVLLSSIWIASKLFLFFSERSFFSCALVLFILTFYYQFAFYFANVLIVSDSSVGTFWQMLSYFFGSLLSNLIIFIFLGLVYHLKLKMYEEPR